LTLIAMLCTAGAVLMLWPPHQRRRTRRVFPHPESPVRSRISMSSTRMLRLVGVLAGLGIGVAIGTWWGWVAGALIAVFAPRLLGRLESRAERDRRETLEKQSAEVADLLAACLSSGAPVSTSASAVADALGEPVATSLRGLAASVNLGADPVTAWRAMGDQPGLGPLCHQVARSLESGAPLADALPGLADDLRRTARATAETAARAAGVRAVAPLAVCFLPAFLLVGVVPIVVSLALPFLTSP
jgi:pilus assembly protein TadC